MRKEKGKNFPFPFSSVHGKMLLQTKAKWQKRVSCYPNQKDGDKIPQMRGGQRRVCGIFR